MLPMEEAETEFGFNRPALDRVQARAGRRDCHGSNRRQSAPPAPALSWQIRWRIAMKAHLQAWRQRWKRAMQNRMTARELEAISPAERMRLADDVCMSGTDLRRINCTHDGPTKLMPSRLEQLGIDPAYVRHDMVGTYRDLERVCASCKSVRRCARDLA